MTFTPAETVYCRFTGEAFTVVSCNGAVAILREIRSGYEHDRPANEVCSPVTGRIVGELTRAGG